jgi:hypothetical protein
MTNAMEVEKMVAMLIDIFRVAANKYMGRMSMEELKLFFDPLWHADIIRVESGDEISSRFLQAEIQRSRNAFRPL